MKNDFKKIRENEYPEAEQYSAYVEKTNEKQKLHEYVKDQIKKQAFPLKVNNEKGKILDIGSGNGVNAFFLGKLFNKITIKGIEPSKAQYDLACRRNILKNVLFENVALQNYQEDNKYDFVLVSHVLQYIQSDIALENFIEKALEKVNKNGEIWFIQQTKEGINQIIQHQKKFLTNDRFNDWKTFEDYQLLMEKVAKKNGYLSKEVFLDSSFENIDFESPTKNDKERLGFILLLEKPFDEQNEEFKKNLSLLDLNKNGRIKHPNGIFKIKKS